MEWIEDATRRKGLRKASKSGSNLLDPPIQKRLIHSDAEP